MYKENKHIIHGKRKLYELFVNFGVSVFNIKTMCKDVMDRFYVPSIFPAAPCCFPINGNNTFDFAGYGIDPPEKCVMKFFRFNHLEYPVYSIMGRDTAGQFQERFQLFFFRGCPAYNLISSIHPCKDSCDSLF